MTIKSILATTLLLVSASVFSANVIDPDYLPPETDEMKADAFLEQMEKICPSCALDMAFVGEQNELKCSKPLTTAEYKKIASDSKVYVFLLALGQQFDDDSIVPNKVRELAAEIHDCDESVWLAGLKIKMKAAPKSYWEKPLPQAWHSDAI